MPVDPQIQALLDRGTGVPATHILPSSHRVLQVVHEPPSSRCPFTGQSVDLADSMTASRSGQAPEERCRWWPWAAGGFLLLVLCLGWFLLPLREWIEALQSWLLGLGVWGVLIFTMILIVVTFLPAPDWPLPVAAGYIYGFWHFL